jgi:hypothetical protein
MVALAVVNSSYASFGIVVSNFVESAVCRQQHNLFYQPVHKFSIHNMHNQWNGRFKSVRANLLCMTVDE